MNISMFDILGPIMIGPSSSHTAGAQRIGKAMYNMIADKELTSVHFMLHGSFHLTLRVREPNCTAGPWAWPMLWM